MLHARIAQRFRQMLEQGFIAEVEALHARSDLHAGLPSIRAVGYRQVWDYLDGKLSYAEMTERGIIATRQLAKRQFTWLRSWSHLQMCIRDRAQAARSLAAQAVRIHPRHLRRNVGTETHEPAGRRVGHLEGAQVKILSRAGEQDVYKRQPRRRRKRPCARWR